MCIFVYFYKAIEVELHEIIAMKDTFRPDKLYKTNCRKWNRRKPMASVVGRISCFGDMRLHMTSSIDGLTWGLGAHCASILS